MKTFEVKIEGVSPLLHHRMPEETLFGLLGAKAKKKAVKVEETPREIADKHAYKNKDGSYYIPLTMISGAFQHVSSDYKQKNSARKSIKAVAGGVFRPTEERATLTDKEGKPIKAFEVDIRKATNHLKGAIAVCRPRFDKWNCKFSVQVDDSILEPEVALEILQDAGRRSGIGSFRVNKSGYFGQFSVLEWKDVQVQ